MNKTMKKILATGLMVVGLGLWCEQVHAVNPDSIVVSVTPSVTYAVSITSVNTSGYQFGTVNLGATTVSTAAIVLTNTGNVAEYFSIAISNTSGSWTAVSGAPSTDQFRMMAYLNGTQPASGTFSDALTNSVPGAAAALYNQASTKTAPAGTKNLWLRLDMPSALDAGGTGAQTMTLTVNGQSL